MPLTLEIVGEKAVQMGGSAKKVFQTGGTIGRLRDNDWVLPDDYISGHHAKIIFSNGNFLIEDTSTNGVFINSPQNRLARGQTYTLRNGDTVFVDDYEVRVSLSADAIAAMGSPARAAFLPEDPFLDLGSGGIGAPDDTDPLRLLGLSPDKPRPRGPTAADLANDSPLSQHYQAPVPKVSAPRSIPTPPSTPSTGGMIPDDYDPLAADDPSDDFQQAPLRTSESPNPTSAASRSQARIEAQTNGQAGQPSPVRLPRPSARGPSITAAEGPSRRAPPRSALPPSSGLDFSSLLAAAGISEALVTPELAEQFGQILRVVVSGVMDILRAREQIKDEFRMRMTTFKAADNNPLKYSANVEDALHNLLVKRNASYLGPVEAFEDAFRDVRNHQMAMLAGMRVAYQAMLSEFEPDRLQEEFDRQVKGGSFLGGSAKTKYWDLYRNRFHDMVKDADSSFRNLFGDEFAKAYEEQLARLKALNRAERG